MILKHCELLRKERNFIRSSLARGESKQANRIPQSISSGRNFCRISVWKLNNQDIYVGCDDILKNCDTNDDKLNNEFFPCQNCCISFYI